jgi:ATP-dependent 26S proteasome regulatory subunit
MTTNHPEKLDAAIKRPGRTDVMVELNFASVN